MRIFNHFIRTKSIHGRIGILFALFISTWFGVAYVQAQSPNSNVSQKMDAVLVIDNSGSMDWAGHDPEQNRFESARIFIDKSSDDVQIAVVDFSGTCKLVLPLTEVSPTQKSIMKDRVSAVLSDRQLTDVDSALRLSLKELTGNNADPAHNPFVILLTDGEIDVVRGTPERKQIAAKRSEEVLFAETIPQYIKNFIPIYTVALGSEINTSVLEKIAEMTKLKDQANEQHHFTVSPGTDLVEVFSSILSQIKKQSRIVKKYHFTGEPIYQTINITPLTKSLEFDVIADRKEDLQVTLKSPDGQIIRPNSEGSKYNYYKINNPVEGQWVVSIIGKGENEVIIATNVEADIMIDLPFDVNFKLGEDMSISAVVMYKNQALDDSVVEVEVEGKKYPFTIEKLLLSIQKPDGNKIKPFLLAREGRSYTYLYKDADQVGSYSLDFDLKAKFMNEKISIPAQKEVSVFRAVNQPTILFEKLKNDYFVGDVVLIALSVTENVGSMQNRSIPINVTSPQGCEIISVPREGLESYSFSFIQTDQEGEYSFRIPETKEYNVINFQQTVSISVPFTLSWKPILAASLGFLLMIAIGLVVYIWIKKRKQESKLKNMSSNTVKDPEETTVKTTETQKKKSEKIEDNSRISENHPVPKEIWIWDNYALVGYVGVTKDSQTDKKDSYYLDYFGSINVALNDIPLIEASVAISYGDTVQLGELEFLIDDSTEATLHRTEDTKVEIYKKNELTRWFIIPSESQPPPKGTVISPVFALGNIINIGQSVDSKSAEPNDIALFHSSVDKIHATIRRDVSYKYFLNTIGKTILNGSVIEEENEMQIFNDDIVEIGDFIFLICLDRKKFMLEVVESSEKDRKP